MSKNRLLTQAKANSAASAAERKVFDPALASLFACSAGPVKIPEPKRVLPRSSEKEVVDNKAEKLDVSDSASDTSRSSDLEIKPDVTSEPPRKRRKVKPGDDIEGDYLSRLAREEEKEAQAQQVVEHLVSPDGEPTTVPVHHDQMNANDSMSESSASNDLLDLSDDDVHMSGNLLPQHESLSQGDSTSTQNQRTVFLSNVCTSAIKSKRARKQLIVHLKSVLVDKDKETVESIRFRSTAFDVSAGPKKAAFARKELMDQTSRNTNAYVVFSSEAAARRVATNLNGSMILDRHIHVDSLANPMRTDNKRCVFVGNLPFVDEETAEQDSNDNKGAANDDAASGRKRQKAKQPADAEEGLWRTFSRCGKIESVRVVRDRATRVGKGFAYVQFEDGNGVEKALLLDGKKFPPLLPRLLRISRAKGMKKKDIRAKDSLRGKTTFKGRKREGGQGMGAKEAKRGSLGRDGVVFEGFRASSGNRMKFKVKGKSRGKKDGIKPASRSSQRGAAFKASGGRKKRDS